MSELTPRNLIPYPGERQEPFFDTAKAGFLAEDAIHYANSENGNLTYTGGGTFTWDSGTGTLAWTSQIYACTFGTPFKAVLPGPYSVTLQDNEVVYYVLPRLPQTNDISISTLYRSNRISVPGTRMNDLRMFAFRSGTTVFLPNGKSLKNGDSGVVFGAGLGTPLSYVPHKHAALYRLDPPPGTTLINPAPVYVAPELVRVDVFKNGQKLVEGVADDYTVDLATGQISLNLASVLGDKFVVWRELRDTSALYTSHTHLGPLVEKPLVPTAVFNMFATSPVLQRVDVFRNGLLLVAPDDYTLDLLWGTVTLVVASAPGDKFDFLRQIAAP